MPNADISLSFPWTQYWSFLSSLWGIFSDQLDLCVDFHYLISASLLGENTKFGFFLASMKIIKGNITNHMAQSKKSYWSSAMPSWHSQTFLHPCAGLAHSWQLSILWLIAGLVNTTNNISGPKSAPCCLVLLGNSILHSKQLLKYQNPHFICPSWGMQRDEAGTISGKGFLKGNSCCATAAPLKSVTFKMLLNIRERYNTFYLIPYRYGIETRG